MRETVAEGLSELVYTIVQCVNRQQYMPPTPTRSGVDDVFDTSFVDVQPYLYRLHYKVNDGRQNRKQKNVRNAFAVHSSESTGTSLTKTFKRVLHDTILK